MSEICEDLVVELGEDTAMESNAADIEQPRIDDFVRKEKAPLTYLWEGGLISFIECIKCYNERAYI